MEPVAGRDERVFLVRMWLEPQDVVWRGSVQDVASGRRRYVTDPSEVADFIAMGLTNAAGPSEEKTGPTAAVNVFEKKSVADG